MWNLPEPRCVSLILPLVAPQKVSHEFQREPRRIVLPHHGVEQHDGNVIHEPAIGAIIKVKEGDIAHLVHKEIGGMGMPHAMGSAISETFCAGSVPLVMYPGLSHGAMLLIKNFGSDELKAQYIEKMMTGEFGGSMCLTESDAGSDVGALKTKAVKQDDGTYKITGQKIFISGGDHEAVDNFVGTIRSEMEELHEWLMKETGQLEGG